MSWRISNFNFDIQCICSVFRFIAKKSNADSSKAYSQQEAQQAQKEN